MKFFALAVCSALLMAVATTVSAQTPDFSCSNLVINGLGSTACTANSTCAQINGECRVGCSAGFQTPGAVRNIDCRSLPWCQTVAADSNNNFAPECRTRCSVANGSPDLCWSTTGCIWFGGQCVPDCSMNFQRPAGILWPLTYTLWDKTGCEATQHCMWTNVTNFLFNGQMCLSNCRIAKEPASCQQLGSQCSWDPWAGCTLQCSTLRGYDACSAQPQCMFVWTNWPGTNPDKSKQDYTPQGYCRKSCNSIRSRGECSGTAPQLQGYGGQNNDCMWNSITNRCYLQCDKIRLVQRNTNGDSNTGSRYNAGDCLNNPACDVQPRSSQCALRNCDQLDVEQCQWMASGTCWVVNGKCVRTCDTMQSYNDYTCVDKFRMAGAQIDTNGDGKKTTLAADAPDAWLCYTDPSTGNCLTTDCGNFTVLGGAFCNAQGGCQWSNDHTCVRSCSNLVPFNWRPNQADNDTCTASPLGCKYRINNGVYVCSAAETDCDKIRANTPDACYGWNRGCQWNKKKQQCEKSCGTRVNETECLLHGCVLHNRSRWGSVCVMQDCASFGSDTKACLSSSTDCIWDQEACSCATRCELRANDQSSCESGGSSCRWNSAFQLCGYPNTYNFDVNQCGGASLSGGAIAGIVIGSFVGVALIIVAIFCIVTQLKGGSSKSGDVGEAARTNIRNTMAGELSYQPVEDVPAKNNNNSNHNHNSSASGEVAPHVMSPQA